MALVQFRDALHLIWMFKSQIRVIDVKTTQLYILSSTLLQTCVPNVLFMIYSRWFERGRLLIESWYANTKRISSVLIELHDVHRHILLFCQILSPSWGLPLLLELVYLYLFLDDILWYRLSLRMFHLEGNFWSLDIFSHRLSASLCDFNLIYVMSSFIWHFQRNNRWLSMSCIICLRW